MRKILFVLSLLTIATAGLAGRAHATDDNQLTEETGGKKWHTHSDGTIHCYGSGGKCIA